MSPKVESLSKSIKEVFSTNLSDKVKTATVKTLIKEAKLSADSKSEFINYWNNVLGYQDKDFWPLVAADYTDGKKSASSNKNERTAGWHYPLNGGPRQYKPDPTMTEEQAFAKGKHEGMVARSAADIDCPRHVRDNPKLFEAFKLGVDEGYKQNFNNPEYSE
jgi:hypothetical protein